MDKLSSYHVMWSSWCFLIFVWLQRRCRPYSDKQYSIHLLPFFNVTTIYWCCDSFAWIGPIAIHFSIIKPNESLFLNHIHQSAVFVNAYSFDFVSYLSVRKSQTFPPIFIFLPIYFDSVFFSCFSFIQINYNYVLHFTFSSCRYIAILLIHFCIVALSLSRSLFSFSRQSHALKILIEIYDKRQSVRYRLLRMFCVYLVLIIHIEKRHNCERVSVYHFNAVSLRMKNIFIRHNVVT